MSAPQFNGHLYPVIYNSEFSGTDIAPERKSCKKTKELQKKRQLSSELLVYFSCSKAENSPGFCCEWTEVLLFLSSDVASSQTIQLTFLPLLIAATSLTTGIASACLATLRACGTGEAKKTKKESYLRKKLASCYFRWSGLGRGLAGEKPQAKEEDANCTHRARKEK